MLEMRGMTISHTRLTSTSNTHLRQRTSHIHIRPEALSSMSPRIWRRKWCSGGCRSDPWSPVSTPLCIPIGLWFQPLTHVASPGTTVRDRCCHLAKCRRRKSQTRTATHPSTPLAPWGQCIHRGHGPCRLPNRHSKCRRPQNRSDRLCSQMTSALSRSLPALPYLAPLTPDFQVPWPCTSRVIRFFEGVVKLWVRLTSTRCRFRVTILQVFNYFARVRLPRSFNWPLNCLLK